MKKFRNIIFNISLILILLFTTKTLSPKNTKASEPLEIEISENTEFIYYIDVNRTLEIDSNLHIPLDDLDYITESDLTKSDYIIVEDKLPAGLEFKGFITTFDGSIGAFKYVPDGEYSKLVTCNGYVVNDTNLEGTWNNEHTEYTYHGLHYNSQTRKISFIVDNLTPECKLTVGVIVETPALESGQLRLDFYNIAQAINSTYTNFSNIVHHYIGDNNQTLYQVNYVADIFNTGSDENLYPSAIEYSSGTEVLVPLEMKVNGYHFDGWTSNDVTITDGKFTMPSNNITIKANYSEDTLYSVTYNIDGYVPEDFSIPSTELAFPGNIIKLNAIKKGDIINGYEFLGWEVTGAVFGDDEKFVMPDNNVIVTGKFALKKYTITYKFEEEGLTEEILERLPEPESYKPGDLVTLPEVESIIYPGQFATYDYLFRGWKSENNFKMPNKDLTIYGTWNRGDKIEPIITLERNDNFPVRPGDDVMLKVKIDNINYVDLFTIKFKTNLKYLYVDDIDNVDLSTFNFTSDLSYIYFDGHVLVTEPILDGTFYKEVSYVDEFYVIYHIDENDRVTSTAEIEIEDLFTNVKYENTKGYDYYLGDENYKATLELDILPKFMLCSKNTTGTYNKNIPPSYIINGDNGTHINISLDNKCMIFFLHPGNYTVQQVLPYQLKNISVSGITTSDNTEFTLDGINDQYLFYTYTFKNVEQELSYLYTNKSWVTTGNVINTFKRGCNIDYVEPTHFSGDI